MERLRIVVAVLFLFSPSIGVAQPAAVARPLVPADVVSFLDIGEIAVSPDGTRIAFTVSENDVDRNAIATRLMVIGPGSPTPRQAALGASSIRWSPDGKRIAFFSGSTLAIVDTSALDGRQTDVCVYDRGNSFVSKAGSYLAWSPDGTKLAFAGTAEKPPAAAEPTIVTRLQYKTRTSISDNRRSHIFVVDARENASPKQITTGEHDDHSIDWSRTGQEIVFLSNREQDPDATLNYDIYAVDVASGAVRQITRTPGVEFDPAVSPDGRWIAYTATTRPMTTIDSVAEDTHVFVVPFGGGPARELNHALDRRSASPEWAPDSAAVLFTAGDHGKTLIYTVPAAGGASKPLFDRNAQATGVSIASDGTIVFGMTDPSIPREVFKLAPGSAAPAQVTHLNESYVARLKLVAPETLAFKSFDGTDVEGWYYPALAGSRSPAGKSPMILSIHGGPHGSYGYAYTAGFQLNASRGYATVAINPRGSNGYGQAFADGCVGNWGGGDYKDLMAGVDYVLQRHPEIDADRLGVMGGSYGGFMTNWVITRTTRFRAAVATASLSNLISFYATSLYQDLVHQEFDGFPWDGDNFAALWRWSPLAHVKQVTTPTLFVHGEADNDVHITQAEEMFTALRRRGIDAALARYPREGHGFREPKHRVDAAARALDWMDRYVLGGTSDRGARWRQPEPDSVRTKFTRQESNRGARRDRGDQASIVYP